MKRVLLLMLLSSPAFSFMCKKSQQVPIHHLPYDIQRAILFAYVQKLMRNANTPKKLSQASQIIVEAIIPAQTYWKDNKGQEQHAPLFSSNEIKTMLQLLEQAISEKTPTELPISYTLLKRFELDAKEMFPNRPSLLDLCKKSQIYVHSSVNKGRLLWVDNYYSKQKTIPTLYALSKLPCARKYQDEIETIIVDNYDFALLNVQPLTPFNKLHNLCMGHNSEEYCGPFNTQKPCIIHHIPKACFISLSTLKVINIQNTDILSIDEEAFIVPENQPSNLKGIVFIGCNFSHKKSLQFLNHLPSSLEIYWDHNHVNGKKISAQELATRYPAITFKEDDCFYRAHTIQQHSHQSNTSMSTTLRNFFYCLIS